MGRDTFIIPILQPSEYREVIGLTKKDPNDFWPITFDLIGRSTIIAIVDMEDNVNESGHDCGNMRRYRNKFSAMESNCDNIRYRSDLYFLPTPVPTPTPPPTQTPTSNN